MDGNERGNLSTLWSANIVVLVIVLSVILTDVLGRRGLIAETCGDKRDACVSKCGVDLDCEQDCELDFAACMSPHARRN